MDVPPSAEALLAEAHWVRALVRGLIADPERREDVLQETWLAALERPPTRGGARGLRAWLGVVARNLARAGRRREGLRPDVERAAARPESFDGEDERERLRLQQLLTEAVLALAEPYRSAIVLRFFDGLGSAAIAKRQGCTNAAARQRVSRGLAELRQRLERRLGRGTWAALLAPLAKPSSAGLPLFVPTVLGLAGLGAAALVWFPSAHEPATAASAHLAPLPLAATATSSPIPAEPRENGAREQALPASAASTAPTVSSVAATTSAESAPSLARVSGHVRGPAGELLDLVGTITATVATARGEKTVSNGFALENEFLLPVPAGRLVRLVASAPGYLPAVRTPGDALAPGASFTCDLALGDVALGGTLEGVLLDARTLAPLAEAWVSCKGSTPLRTLGSTTDAAGRFRIAGLEAAALEEAGEPSGARLSVGELPGYASLRAADVHFLESSGGGQRVELRLEPTTCTLAGEVFEPDGTPARFAWIRGLDASGRLLFAQADARGRYALLRALPAGKLRLRARSFDDVRSTGATEEELVLEPFERRTAELRLARADTRVELRVLDVQGRGLAGVVVACRSTFAGGVFETCPEETLATSDAEGRVRFADLPPGSYTLQPRSRELGAEPPQRPLRLARGATLAPGDFLVGARFSIEGRVEASGDPSGAFRVVARELRTASERAVAPRADGRFAFDGLVASAYELVLLRNGAPCARLTVGPDDAREIVLAAP